MFAYLFWNTQKKTVLLGNKIKQLHHAVLHPCENKTQVVTSEQRPAVQGISLLELQQKGCFCTNESQFCPAGEKANCFIYWKVPFPNENTCSASHILELFQEVLGFFFFPFLIWYCSFLRNCLKTSTMQKATQPILLSQCLGFYMCQC